MYMFRVKAFVNVHVPIKSIRMWSNLYIVF